MTALLSAGMTLTRQVFVTFRLVGFHRWPDAPEEVAYLRETHRHLFHFRVDAGVEEEDRELEFHIFKRHVEAIVDQEFAMNEYAETTFGSMSCESIATHLFQGLKDGSDIGKNLRFIRVEVSEDNENGAVLTARYPGPR